MIVKNEAARIERCLASVAPYISTWCVLDTGSTDDTQEIIRRFFDKSKTGMIFETPFVNFSATRNHALRCAEVLPYDYLFLVDADMELVVDNLKWADNLTDPAYKLLQKNAGLSYWNVRLLRCDTQAHYIGATHEYLSIEGGDAPNLSGAWFIDHADGANREGKFERDAALLKREIEPQARSWYYLAQSLRDMGDKRGAAEAYGVCAQIDQWPEEKWHAELSRARCLHDYGAPEWALVALSAYGHRPQRAEPLYDLARHFREKGLNEVSLLFSTMACHVERPKDDLLFVEDAVYDYGLCEEFSICAFYSDRWRDIGRIVCNDLSLSRSVPQQVRDNARQNLFWYSKSLIEFCQSFEVIGQIHSPNEWNATNPSIARFGEELRMIVRAVNYHIDDAGRYIMPDGETTIRTRNYICSDLEFYRHHHPKVDPIKCLGMLEELSITLGEPLYNQVLGLEDMRLFEWRKHLWYSATTRQTNSDGFAEQGCGQIGGSHVVMHPPGERRHEKNWMPIVGCDKEQIQFVYSCDPTRIVSCRGETIRETIPSFACENFRGGSQLIPFDDGYLALIHEPIASPIDNKRCYQHRFVWFDGEIVLEHVSPRFWFHANNQIEFAAGMCWHPDERRLIVSYGIRDAEAWIATVEASEVRGLLGMKDRSWTIKTASEEREGAGLCPSYEKLPETRDLLSHSWALGNTNRPLRTHAEIDVAVAHLNNLKLPRHPDYPKNWDNMLAIAHAMATTKKNGLIIDAGGTHESAFLPGLHYLGYKYLQCWNTAFEFGQKKNEIAYIQADITNFDLWPNALSKSVNFVACLSVIEHGVDVEAFFKEMGRIISSGGHLFVSFDYWEAPIDCGDRVAFGAPVRVFSRGDVWKMIYDAGDRGFTPVGEVDYKCGERVVQWLGLEFTFMNLLFRRS